MTEVTLDAHCLTVMATLVLDQKACHMMGFSLAAWRDGEKRKMIEKKRWRVIQLRKRVKKYGERK